MIKVLASLLHLLIWYHILRYVGGDVEINFAGVEMHYSDAVVLCGSLNGEWSMRFPKDVSYIEVIHDKYIRTMMQKGVKSVWLPLRKRHLSGWKYPRNNTYTGPVAGTSDCGSLSLRYESVEGKSCATAGQGWVCQKECEFCPPDISPYNCIRGGSTCYILGCDAGSWYEARNACEKMGAHLAEIPDQSAALKLAREIKKSYRPCQDYWSGLRKADWVFESDMIGSDTPGVTYWGQNEPSLSGDCAILTQNNKGFFWAAVSCSSQHKVICTAGTNQLTTVPQSTITAKDIITTGSLTTLRPGNGIVVDGLKDGQLSYPSQMMILTVLPIICASVLIVLVGLVIVFKIINQIKKTIGPNKQKGEEEVGLMTSQKKRIEPVNQEGEEEVDL